MKNRSVNYLDLLIERYPQLLVCKKAIKEAYFILFSCFDQKGKLLVAGNGGSCADAEHIAGELMKGFKIPRVCSSELKDKLINIDKTRGEEIFNKIQGALPTIALHNHQSLNTAFINDVDNGGELLFAQQVYGYGNEKDVLLAISTSGNSKNIINATILAKAKGMKIICLTGENGGELAKFADVAIKVPAVETYMAQELHLPIYHCLCLMLEERFFLN